jgi:hypothetical protein
MVYRTALSIGASGTAAAPITLALASDAGHNGTAVLFGGRSTSLPACNQAAYTYQTSDVLSTAVMVDAQYVVVDGMKRSGIAMYGFNGAGVSIDPSAAYITLRNLEVFGNGVAAYGNVMDTEGTWPTPNLLTGA